MCEWRCMSTVRHDFCLIYVHSASKGVLPRRRSCKATHQSCGVRRAPGARVPPGAPARRRRRGARAPPPRPPRRGGRRSARRGSRRQEDIYTVAASRGERSGARAGQGIIIFSRNDVRHTDTSLMAWLLPLMPRCGTRPLARRVWLSPPEHRTAPQPARNGRPPP